MKTPNLPPELLSVIIGYLSPSKKALKTCSLVNRQWFHATRPFYFHTIIFSIRSGIHPGEMSSLNWIRLFHNEADVFRQVLIGQRRLDESPQNYDLVRHFHLNDFEFESTLHWQSLQLQISLIVQKLHNLTHLTLHQIEWLWVSQDLRQSLRPILDNPVLEHLFLSAFSVAKLHDLVELLSFSRNLRTLHLMNVRFTQDGGIQNSTIVEYIQSGTLICGGTRLNSLYLLGEKLTPTFSWLLNPSISAFDLSALTHLSIDRFYPNSVDDINLDVLRRCSRSLQHLELYGYYGPSSITIPTNLRTLKIQDIHDIGTLVEFFARMEEPMDLEVVFLRVAFPPPRDGWAELDKMLSRRELSKLTRVILAAGDETDEPHPVEEYFPESSRTKRVEMGSQLW